MKHCTILSVISSLSKVKKNQDVITACLKYIHVLSFWGGVVADLHKRWNKPITECILSLLQLTTYFSIVCWDNAVFVIRFRHENQLVGVSSLGWHRHDWRCFNFLVKVSGICIWKLSRVRLSLTNVETQSQSAVTNSTTIPPASWNEGPLVMLVHRRQHRVVCGILNEHLIQATWPRSNMTLCLRRTGTHWSDCFINCITPLDS